jgi:hypothetical protein
MPLRVIGCCNAKWLRISGHFQRRREFGADKNNPLLIPSTRFEWVVIFSGKSVSADLQPNAKNHKWLLAALFGGKC